VHKLRNNIIRSIDPMHVDASDYIKDDGRYWPYFRDCIGAINGTRITLHLPTNKKLSFLNRK